MSIINVAHAGIITDAPSVASIGMNALFFLLSVAGILAIIFLVIAGLKYFLAMGDQKEMQSAKKSAQGALTGIVLAMGGLILINLLGKFLN